MDIDERTLPAVKPFSEGWSLNLIRQKLADKFVRIVVGYTFLFTDFLLCFYFFFEVFDGRFFQIIRVVQVLGHETRRQKGHQKQQKGCESYRFRILDRPHVNSGICKLTNARLKWL